MTQLDHDPLTPGGGLSRARTNSTLSAAHFAHTAYEPSGSADRARPRARQELTRPPWTEVRVRCRTLGRSSGGAMRSAASCRSDGSDDLNASQSHARPTRPALRRRWLRAG